MVILFVKFTIQRQQTEVWLYSRAAKTLIAFEGVLDPMPKNTQLAMLLNSRCSSRIAISIILKVHRKYLENPLMSLNKGGAIRSSCHAPLSTHLVAVSPVLIEAMLDVTSKSQSSLCK